MQTEHGRYKVSGTRDKPVGCSHNAGDSSEIVPTAAEGVIIGGYPDLPPRCDSNLIAIGIGGKSRFSILFGVSKVEIKTKWKKVCVLRCTRLPPERRKLYYGHQQFMKMRCATAASTIARLFADIRDTL